MIAGGGRWFEIATLAVGWPEITKRRAGLLLLSWLWGREKE